jgi:hypothetical protein
MEDHNKLFGKLPQSEINRLHKRVVAYGLCLERVESCGKDAKREGRSDTETLQLMTRANADAMLSQADISELHEHVLEWGLWFERVKRRNVIVLY